MYLGDWDLRHTSKCHDERFRSLRSTFLTMSRVITPLPGGGVYHGDLDGYLELVPAYFREMLEYARKWNNLFIPFAVDIWSRNTGERFDPSWKTDLEKIFNDKTFHDKIFCEEDYSVISCPSMRDFFEESKKLMLVRDRHQPCDVIDVTEWPSLQGMAGFDKSQEVIYLTNAIDVLLSHCFERDDTILHHKESHPQLVKLLQESPPPSQKPPLSRENIVFIDVGAGKGYFSVFMSAEMRVKTLTIEASLSHASHLRNRIGCLVSQKRLNTEKLDLMQLCIGYMTTETNVEAIQTNSVTYDEWESIVDQMDARKGVKRKGKRMIGPAPPPAVEMDVDELKYAEQGKKPRVIQGELAVEVLSVPEYDLSPNEYITIGLHACGDLSIVTHEIALNSNQARGAISVPCCYQHLTHGRVPLVPENREICDVLFNGDDEQRHNKLNYALYEYHVDFETHRKILSQFVTRAIIDCFIPPRVTIKKIQRRTDESLVDYIIRVAEFFDRHPTRDEVEAKVAECEETVWKMMAHAVIREQFGHVFETFLLMDRLTYLAQLVREKPNHYFIGMYDVFTHLSPRGFSLFTIRV